MRFARFMRVLLFDNAGATTHEYVVAAVVLMFAAIVLFASRPIGDLLVSLLQSVHLVAAQATP